MVITLLLASATFVFAKSSSVYAKWYTGNAGSVNGATSTYPINVTLMKDTFGFDANYGTVKIKTTETKKYKFSKPVPKSGKFYLILGGGKHDMTHTYRGTLSN